MKTFVKFDKNGNIVATCRVGFVPQELQHPYLDLAEGESVIAVEPEGPVAGMSCLDMHNNYKVDVSKGKLVSKRGRDLKSGVEAKPRR